jgi:hypothetical protein
LGSLYPVYLPGLASMTPFPPESTLAQAACEAARVSLASAIQESAADLRCDVKSEVSVAIPMSLLAQLMQNLIGNAIQYRRKDIPPRVYKDDLVMQRCRHMTDTSRSEMEVPGTELDAVQLAFNRLSRSLISDSQDYHQLDLAVSLGQPFAPLEAGEAVKSILNPARSVPRFGVYNRSSDPLCSNRHIRRTDFHGRSGSRVWLETHRKGHTWRQGALVSNSCLILVSRREAAWVDKTRNYIEQSALVGFEPLCWAPTMGFSRPQASC